MKRYQTIALILLVVGVLFVAGCSGSAQEDQYDYNPPPQYGGGCGVVKEAPQNDLLDIGGFTSDLKIIF